MFYMHKYVQKFGESELQLFTVRFVSLKRYIIKLRFVRNKGTFCMHKYVRKFGESEPQILTEWKNHIFNRTM